jgi:hypothetical protein
MLVSCSVYFLWPYRWRRLVPLKCQLTLTWPHSILSKKIEHNPKKSYYVVCFQVIGNVGARIVQWLGAGQPVIRGSISDWSNRFLRNTYIDGSGTYPASNTAGTLMVKLAIHVCLVPRLRMVKLCLGFLRRKPSFKVFFLQSRFEHKTELGSLKLNIKCESHFIFSLW